MAEFSPEIGAYFKDLKSELMRAYHVAEAARKLGFDPENHVEIPIVENMAERCEGLISVVAPQIKGSGVSERIKELEEEYGSLDWRVALTIGLEVAKQKYCKFKDEHEAITIGIRTGFAYLTMGIVASPLEGFVELKIKKTRDGKDYFALSYAGPVRSAGGTGASVSVILADYIRHKMGYAAYDPTEEEAKRFVTELYDYHERITNLQYLPSEEEIEFLGKHLPVQIDGDGSEKIEVSNFKDLDRVETNRIRNGVCLTIGEGIAQKAPKLWKQLSKWGHDFDLAHWDFIGEFVTLQKKIKAKGAAAKKAPTEGGPKILPDTTFIKDLVGGRPIFTHPLREGGFRLRFGRTRTSGFSSYNIHPATMAVMNDFLAVGTQLKNERPGKGCTVTVCDSIEGPIVRLKNGNVLYLDDFEEAKRISPEVEQILFNGDILINYGDFFNRAHTLCPPGYCEEWWIRELEEKVTQKEGICNAEIIAKRTGIEKEVLGNILNNPLSERPTALQSVILSRTLGVPLHPKYSYHFGSMQKDDMLTLYDALLHANFVENSEGFEKAILKYSQKLKGILERAGIVHELVNNEFLILDKNDAFSLHTQFAISEKKDLTSIEAQTGTAFINLVSPIKVRDKSGLFIGARMGRPEKAKMRQLQGSPQVLFPIGDEGGRLRSFQSALEVGKVSGEFPVHFCAACKEETIFGVCERCGGNAPKVKWEEGRGIVLPDDAGEHAQDSRYRQIDIKHYFGKALEHLGITQYPDLIKGVRGTSNKSHDVERIEKGILRAKHDIYVNKEGTTRYDMTQLPITHFKPFEVGTPVKRLQELGYTHDCYGAPFTSEDQVLEIKPQDIILPKNIGCLDEGAHKVLTRIAQFMDDMLTGLYRLKPYYNVKDYHDLIGHIVLMLAPHTSGGIAARIIGFSDTQGLYAHPMMHAATRRDCDGDEACVVMLLDVLINFSRHFLPAHRGSTQDAPLVLTWMLTPAEVDDMAFDVDVVWKYPKEFYDACLEYKKPWDVEIERIGTFLGQERQYEKMGFTHTISDINNGVLISSYKTLPTMQDKLVAQMDLAEKLRSVDTGDVARLVIEKHFLKDIKGNLRKFSMQEFRCVGCNEKYRRPPLAGKCKKCGGKIIFTISEGSVLKYLQPSLELGEKYKIPSYLKQTLDILEQVADGVFGKQPEKQEGLDKWF
ncbi:DNA polymerase II large subunit [Candidatus Woesearchaeota archaeon]|nr:DNA polymerase II large subunit [Candidatus Woesearchaeota archaeon]